MALWVLLLLFLEGMSKTKPFASDKTWAGLLRECLSLLNDSRKGEEGIYGESSSEMIGVQFFFLSQTTSEYCVDQQSFSTKESDRGLLHSFSEV